MNKHFSSSMDITWPNAVSRPEPTIVHRVPLKRAHPGDFITMGDIEKAVNEATSWVRRNCREWPYRHRLTHRIEGDEMIFWFEPEE
jgi:hypothetical protein